MRLLLCLAGVHRWADVTARMTPGGLSWAHRCVRCGKHRVAS